MTHNCQQPVGSPGGPQLVMAVCLPFLFGGRITLIEYLIYRSVFLKNKCSTNSEPRKKVKYESLESLSGTICKFEATLEGYSFP